MLTWGHMLGSSEVKVAVIGTTAWGTTLGVVLGRKGIETKLWARTEEEVKTLNKNRENKTRLPKIIFPLNLRATNSSEDAFEGTRLIIIAVPSDSFLSNIKTIKKYLKEPKLILIATKGLEIETTKRMSEVILEELEFDTKHQISVLSGPNLSREVAEGMPTTAVAASQDISIAKEVQKIITSPSFRIYTSKDVIGVELGGALKNIIALAAGMSDGLGYGSNTKAALITRGLAEITRLGVAVGAKASTFSGLAGLGDLVATCTSSLSRNRFVGQELAKGRSLNEILSSMKETAEGVNTAAAARKLALKLNVEMPITEQVCRVLFENIEVREAVPALMGRDLKYEFYLGD